MGEDAEVAPGREGSGLGDKGIGSRLVELAFQAAPAIGGAIGFVGFVAVTGAAIQWVRFSAANLPADQAVQVMPRTELVSIGASFLILYTVLAVVAVLLVYLLDPKGETSRGTRWGLVAVVIAEMAIALSVVDIPSWGYMAAAFWLAGLAGTSLITLAWLTQRVDRLRAQQELRDLAEELVEAEGDLATAEGERRDAETLRTAEVQKPTRDEEAVTLTEKLLAGKQAARDVASRKVALLQESLDEAVGRLGRRALGAAVEGLRPVATGQVAPAAVLWAVDAVRPPAPDDGAEIVKRVWHWLRARARIPAVWRSMLLVAALGALAYGLSLLDAELVWLAPIWAIPFGIAVLTRSAPAFGIALFAAGILTLAPFDETSWLIAVLAVAALFGIGNLAIADATSQFAWYAVAVFMSVLLFGALFTAARTLRTPKLQPAALVRKSDSRGICGIYVTETNDRVYLARINLSGNDRDSSGRLFWVPSSDVDVVKVGTYQKLPQAEKRALALLEETYADRAWERPPQTKGRTVTKVTTARGVTTTTVTEKPAPPPRSIRRVPPPESTSSCSDPLPALDEEPPFARR